MTIHTVHTEYRRYVRYRLNSVCRALLNAAARHLGFGVL